MHHRITYSTFGLTFALLLAGCGLFGATPTPTLPPRLTPRVTATEPTSAPVPTVAPVQPVTAVSSVPPTFTPLPPTLTPPPPTATPTLVSSPIPVVPTSTGGGLLQKVKARGRLLCGTNGELPGFSQKDKPTGTYNGFEADFCRVIATAIFGDRSKVEFIPLTAENRFDAVVLGTVDVLIRNTTWTATRDVGMISPTLGKIRLDFGPTLFHDGQRFMVHQGLKINGTQLDVSGVANLVGKRICVIDGTTTVLNLKDQFKARGLEYTAVIGKDANEAFAFYEAGECDAITSDSSQLISRRESLNNPASNIILDEQISREPLGPVFIENDSQWRDVVSWSIFATIYGEELGVDSTNAAQLINAPNPDIQRLLGSQGSIGTDLGLSNDFALRIIQEVGNYEEIYLRNLGPTTPYKLDRGPNKAWNKGQGGVLSSPPFR